MSNNKVPGLLSRIFSRFLDYVEIIGNKLPHPATLFALLAFMVTILSWIAASTHLTAIHPADGSLIEAKNLLDGDGLRWMYTNIINNFVKFPPLGIVLAIMVGIGVAEGSGLITALIRALVLSAPKSMITFALVLAGVISHTASEAGYVVLIPLGAAIFYALGRHPMAGLAAAFVGVSGGFGANFIITSIDPVLSGLSQSAANMLDPTITISPAVNLYFSFVSGFLVVIVGTFVTEKIVEPRLGKYEGHAEKIEIKEITPVEKKGLIYAAISFVALLAFTALLTVPEGSLLRNPETGSVLHSAFMEGMPILILLVFLIPGIVYGIVNGSIRDDKNLMKFIVSSMNHMGSYIVLVFFAAQFVYFFIYSNLGVIFAINGAHFLKEIGLTGIPLIIGFVLLSAFINMFMGSASAKWALMAPVFIPMLMLLGYHPGLTQAAFRVGDSLTNIITPMMSYFALIVTFAQKYDDKYGIGTIISTMLPYTLILTVLWSALLVIWMLIGLPLGPDGFLYLEK